MVTNSDAAAEAGWTGDKGLEVIRDTDSAIVDVGGASVNDMDNADLIPCLDYSLEYM
jgi:hypothetical protein